MSGDRDEIVELTAKLGLFVDARDWEGARRLFLDPVEVDYTSLDGGEPQTIDPAGLVAAWEQGLGGLQATHHLIANHVVELDGDEATCAAAVHATHVRPNRLGGPVWTLGGRYDFRFRRTPDGWRITAMKLTVAWATGNRRIMQPD